MAHSRRHVEVLRIGLAAAKQVRQPLCSLMEASSSSSDMLGRVQSVVLAYAKYTEGSKSRDIQRSPTQNAKWDSYSCMHIPCLQSISMYLCFPECQHEQQGWSLAAKQSEALFAGGYGIGLHCTKDHPALKVQMRSAGKSWMHWAQLFQSLGDKGDKYLWRQHSCILPMQPQILTYILTYNVR